MTRVGNVDLPQLGVPVDVRDGRHPAQRPRSGGAIAAFQPGKRRNLRCGQTPTTTPSLVSMPGLGTVQTVLLAVGQHASIALGFAGLLTERLDASTLPAVFRRVVLPAYADAGWFRPIDGRPTSACSL